MASKGGYGGVPPAMAAKVEKASPQNCEWRFGDTHGLAKFNPGRWSGGISFDECVKQLEDTLQKADRPIVVKCPAGLSSPEHLFDTVSAAIGYVKSVDPTRMSAKQAAEAAQAEVIKWEAIKTEKEVELTAARMGAANKEAAAEDRQHAIEAARHAEAEAELKAKHAKSELDCEWMYGDAGAGAIGIKATASLNPFRWSGSLSLEDGASKLEAVLKENRPIIVKVPSGLKSKEQHFNTTQEAIDYLNGACPIKKAAAEAVVAAHAALVQAEAAGADDEALLEVVRKDVCEAFATNADAVNQLAEAKKRAEETAAQLSQLG